MTADEHIIFLNFVLSVLEKTIDIFIAIIVDNCALNQSISGKVARSFIGCASYRFQLAFHNILMEYQDVVSVLNSLMVKF